MEYLQFWSVIIIAIWSLYSLVNARLKNGIEQTLSPFHIYSVTTLQILLLYCGGFFHVHNQWPQITYIIMTGFGILMTLTNNSRIVIKRSLFTTIISESLMWTIYYNGGFWIN